MVIDGPMGRIAASLTLILALNACTQAPGTVAPTSTPPTTSAPATTTPPSAAIVTPPPSATPVATPTPTPRHAIGVWALDTTLPDFEVGDVVSSGDGLIAVGCRPGPESAACVGAAIEVSTPDGWTPAALDDGAGEIALAAVATDARGLTAVGFERGPALDSFGNPATTAVSFTSSDGLAWSRAPAQGSFDGSTMIDVVARPNGGWIAVGAKAGQSVYYGFETWSSADGSTWKHIGSMPEVDVSGVASFGDGLVAWGDDCLDACGPVPAVIWTSIDGTDWKRAPDQPSLDATHIGDMVGLPNAMLAVGSKNRDDEIPVGTTWRSTDVATWPSSALPDGAEHVSFRVALGDHALVTVGAQGSGDDVGWDTWSSADGATWRRLPDATLAPGVVPSFPRPVLAFDGTSVIFLGQSASTPTEASVFRLWLD